jgi:RimJ/RimL family protein N-acetyltransferase
VSRLVARIHPDNEASQRTFLRAGWYGLVSVTEDGRSWLRLERRIARWGT